MTVSVGDGVSLVLVQPAVYRGETTPTVAQIGDLWVDTSGGGAILKRCTSIAPITFTAVDTGGGGGGGGIALAAGTQTATTDTVVFSNSNNITFGMVGSTRITASASFNQTTQPSIQSISAGTTRATTGEVVFSNSNGFSFGLNGNTLTGSYTVPTQTAFVFSNSNNVSFGTNASTVTATATFAQSVQPAIQSISAGTTRATTGEVVWSNSNGISFGLNGNTVTASYTVPNVPAQTEYVFSNSNNVSFGTNGSTVTATVTVPAQTNQTLGLYAVSNTTGQSSSSTFDARSLSFQGAGVASVGYSNGSVVVSVPSGGGAGDGYNILAAGTQTATTAGTVAFVDSNGITFGMSGSTQITASHNGITQQSTQPVAVSGSNGSFAFSTLTLGSSNGMHFYTTNNSIVGSYTIPTVTNSSWTVSDNGTSGTVGRLAFTNLNGVTLSLSTGAGGSHTIVGSHNGLTSQSNQAFSAQGGSSAFQTLVFTNSNGVSFSNTNGSIWGSHNGITSQSNQVITMYATSNTTQSSTGTQNASSLIFAGAGIASVGVTNGSVIISVPSGGGGGDGGVFAGASNLGNTAGSTGTVSTGNFVLVGSGPISLSQSTGGAGSAATVSIIGPATSSLVGVSPISISTNGSTISVSYVLARQSFFHALDLGNSTAVSQVGNGTVAIYPIMREGAFTATRAQIYASLSVSSSSNSSHAGALSAYIGLYTRNGSTLSLASSGSQSYQWTNTSNNSLGSIASLRAFTVPINVNYTGGDDLWMAVMSRSSTTNANWFTASNVLQSYAVHSGQVVGLIGEASNATRGILGYGRFSASSSALPASMGFTQITGGLGGTASASRLMPNVYFANFTV